MSTVPAAAAATTSDSAQPVPAKTHHDSGTRTETDDLVDFTHQQNDKQQHHQQISQSMDIVNDEMDEDSAPSTPDWSSQLQYESQPVTTPIRDVRLKSKQLAAYMRSIRPQALRPLNIKQRGAKKVVQEFKNRLPPIVTALQRSVQELPRSDLRRNVMQLIQAVKRLHIFNMQRLGQEVMDMLIGPWYILSVSLDTDTAAETDALYPVHVREAFFSQSLRLELFKQALFNLRDAVSVLASIQKHAIHLSTALAQEDDPSLMEAMVQDNFVEEQQELSLQHELRVRNGDSDTDVDGDSEDNDTGDGDGAGDSEDDDTQDRLAILEQVAHMSSQLLPSDLRDHGTVYEVL